MTAYDVAVLKKATECAKYLKSVGSEVGNEIAEKSIKKVQKVKNEPSAATVKQTASLRDITKNQESNASSKKLNQNEPSNMATSSQSSPLKTNKKLKSTPASNSNPNLDSSQKNVDTKKKLSESTSKSKKLIDLKLAPTDRDDSYDENEDTFYSNNQSNASNVTSNAAESRKLKDTSAQTIIFGSTNQKLVMLKESDESFSSGDDDDETTAVDHFKNARSKRLNKRKSNPRNKFPAIVNKNGDDGAEEIYNNNSNNDELNAKSTSKTKNAVAAKSNPRQRPENMNTNTNNSDKTEMLDAEIDKKRNDKRSKNLSNAYGANNVKASRSINEKNVVTINKQPSKAKTNAKNSNSKDMNDELIKEIDEYSDDYDEIYTSLPEKNVKNDTKCKKNSIKSIVLLIEFSF